MVVTLDQQYNIGEKPTVILYSYINLFYWLLVHIFATNE